MNLNIATEIRKLPTSNVKELAYILDLNESWKKLMAIIPKVLQKDLYECNISMHNPHKYNSEHFKILECESFNAKPRRLCAEILFDEWGTSGRVRPALGHLLYLLTKAELYRAADYVAVTLLNAEPPARPAEGPAAIVTMTFPDKDNEEIERILDAIDYPSSVIANLINNSYDVNLNYSSKEHSVPIIPKIVISDPEPNRDDAIAMPLVIESRRRMMNRQNASIVDENVDSDMMKFSQPEIISETNNVIGSNNKEAKNTFSDMMKFSGSQVSSDSDNVSSNNSIVPDISAIMNSDSDSHQMQSSEIETSNRLPNLSALNINSDSTITEVEENLPAPTTSTLSENLPVISDLLESNANYTSSSVLDTERLSCEDVPNLSILGVDQQDELPQITLLNNNSSVQSNNKKIPVIINLIQPESSASVPQISALLSDKKSYNSESKHFLPITDHASDIPSETSSMASSKNSNVSSEISHNSNLSQRSDLSRSSRPTCVSPLPTLSLNTQLPHFTYYEVECGTNNFDDTPHKNCRQVENALAHSNGRFLGSGAFGSVFLALGIADKPVAVKKLFLDNMDIVNVDDPVTKQFTNEVEVLCKYKHENLLSLVGYSCDGPTYCLLYEFIPGGALKDRLQNIEEKLIWTDRLYIALGTSRAVSYLHTAYNVPLIHRDIKTANILLDCTNKPKLCDFGLIKLLPNQNTNTSTSAFGTNAYMAREAFRGDVSVKLDSYSFGVVLLELITGLPPIDENREGCDLVTHVEEVCDDNITPLVDTKAGSWVAKEINFAEELYKISIKCLEQNKKRRPTMVEVTEKLSDLIKKCL